MKTWKDVESYCREQLSAIVDINSAHPCPSAFVCIAAFMSYLSRLAYGTNVKTDRHDRDWFMKFVENFMHPKYRSHAELMYRTFRCGILHSMSFDDEIDGNRTEYLDSLNGNRGDAPLAIAHDKSFSCLCNGNQLVQESTTQAYVLVAEVLCKDIERAITEMFKDVAVQRNCEEFVECQRFIEGKKVPCPARTTGVPPQQSVNPVVTGSSVPPVSSAARSHQPGQDATLSVGTDSSPTGLGSSIDSIPGLSIHKAERFGA